MNNNKLTVPIIGMHCKSCELLIEEQLNEIKAVKKARVNFHRGQAEIFYEGNLDQNEINKAVQEAGYQVGSTNDKRLFISRNKTDYQDLAIAFLILIGVYFILKGLGITNISFNTSEDGLTVPIVLLVGLTAGISSCMALVGGLILGISAKHNEQHPEATAGQKFRPHLFFNLGRILTFAVLGGVLGLIGSSFQLSATALGALTVFIGLVMLIMGLQIIEIFPWISHFKLTLPKGISRVLGLKRHQQEYSHKNSMILGGLTFFLPCGFTTAMQIYAVGSGSFTTGALIMSLFALGTAPGLLGIGGLTAMVKGIFARRFFKFAGLAVIAFAFLNIANGFNLTGISFAVAKETVNVNDPNVIIKDGAQIIKMVENNNGYSPNSFTIKKDVPVKWIIDAQAPYSCASSLIVPKLNIRKNLTAGQNIIEFTAKTVGKISFSCSMGMYTGVFNVVDDSGKTAVNSASVAVAASQPALSSGSCGINGGGCGGCGGGKNIQINSVATKPDVVLADNQITAGKVQVLKATFTNVDDMQPNSFVVKAGQPVRLEVYAQENGRGCMSTIKVQKLYENIQSLRGGQTAIMEFTPTEKGDYIIACAMNIPHGVIKVE